MLFNSVDFAIFLPLVFLIYWFIFNRNLKLQNLFIVAASYLFYGWWDWRFLSLVLISSLVDYLVGRALAITNHATKRKWLLFASIFLNLGLLGFFKYFNFFADSFVSAFSLFGKEFSATSLNIVLPVGISFYTFQTLSYSIDVYRRKLEPTKDFIAFSAFVTFFPQLVAGPIERATNLLPQFYKKRIFNYPMAVDGLKQMLWGFFKKMVIADRCAEYANMIFDNSDNLPGSILILGAFFFAFQIYGDFSGYSDIAIGASKLFGFDLMQNFAFPYFSRDIAEFWRRWHISLTTWFRDYLYIPLGGSKGGVWNKIRNTFIVFLVSGFWHGANWTFVAWGLINALFFIPLLISGNNRKHLDIVAKERKLPSIKELFQMFFTFSLCLLAWVFFRAESIEHAFSILSRIFSTSVFEYARLDNPVKILTTVGLVVLFIIAEWFGRKQAYAIETWGKSKAKVLNWSLYYLIIVLIFVFGGAQQSFIYFQF